MGTFAEIVERRERQMQQVREIMLEDRKDEVIRVLLGWMDADTVDQMIAVIRRGPPAEPSIAYSITRHDIEEPVISICLSPSPADLTVTQLFNLSDRLVSLAREALRPREGGIGDSGTLGI